MKKTRLLSQKKTAAQQRVSIVSDSKSWHNNLFDECDDMPIVLIVWCIVLSKLYSLWLHRRFAEFNVSEYFTGYLFQLGQFLFLCQALCYKFAEFYDYVLIRNCIYFVVWYYWCYLFFTNELVSVGFTYL